MENISFSPSWRKGNRIKDVIRKVLFYIFHRSESNKFCSYIMTQSWQVASGDSVLQVQKCQWNWRSMPLYLGFSIPVLELHCPGKLRPTTYIVGCRTTHLITLRSHFCIHKIDITRASSLKGTVEAGGVTAEGVLSSTSTQKISTKEWLLLFLPTGFGK